MSIILTNRREAGRRLARKLSAYANHPQTVVLGLPRGGVPVAYEIAKALNLPLDVCLVKKLALPENPEFAIGAIAEDSLITNYSGEVIIVDENTRKIKGLDKAKINAIAAQQKAELQWRDRCYRHFRAPREICDQTVILVDDGVATGLTIHAAVTALNQHKPEKIIIAVPVISLQIIKQLKYQLEKIEIICVNSPQSLSAVSFWYEDFSETTDREVCELLSEFAPQLIKK
ncbi:putative phosphoribosyltransferase [Xenococcus sp. PCC 7305]|uniref:phosphoribosyltransferase n=1 Tax=Xenococcus sp. PCC 7305 TaxID=102125 RepID=UPI0002AC6DD4|nr:phosphoribosyltransferase family protein [Xenococcus sp. PCC 7305]ELS03011.1 putative phosphoribosyltransferase [Xenococcus sp. PCC 7305]